MPDIFLSYSRDDQKVVRLFAEGFEREGFSVWWDATLNPGEAFDQVIEKALLEAKAVVVLWSKKSVASRWVRAEATQASDNGTLFPATIEPCKRPIMFELTHTADLSHWKGDPNDQAWRSYVAGVRRFIDKGAPISSAALILDTARNKQTISVKPVGVWVTVAIAAAGVLWALIARNRDHPRVEQPSTSAPAPATAISAGTAPDGAAVAAAVPEHSIAVLPFVNMSEDKNNEYFSDGLSEELIDLLTKVPGLQVPARTSSFYFKDKQATIAEIAHALGVAHVLEGSVRKSGNTLRITAQLVRADNGYEVWSETFDRQLTDVFKIQDEIAGAVVQTLKGSLLEGQAPKAELTTNTSAYTLYLEAESISRTGALDDIHTAILDMQKAVSLDNRFSAAWRGLAVLLVSDLNWHSATPYQHSCEPAHIAANKALELEPTSAAGHTVKGLLLSVCDWDWSGAETQFKEALKIEPENPDALSGYSSLADTLDRPAQAVQLAQKAVSRDPLNSRLHFRLAVAQSTAGNFSAADASLRRTLALNPNFHGVHTLLAYELLADRKPSEALQEANNEPDEEFRQVALPMVFAALGRKSDADREFSILVSKYPDHEALVIAEYYACRGQIDESLKWLQRNLALHLGLSDVPPLSTCLRKLEGDPRYRELRHKMGLPQPVDVK
ncbi:MAG TPA: TIR domain-containing protein [Steroidobacteraceae bacterium]